MAANRLANSFLSMTALLCVLFVATSTPAENRKKPAINRVVSLQWRVRAFRGA